LCVYGRDIYIVSAQEWVIGPGFVGKLNIIKIFEMKNAILVDGVALVFRI